MGILRNYTHCENGNKSNQAPWEAAQRRPRLFITTGMIFVYLVYVLLKDEKNRIILFSLLWRNCELQTEILPQNHVSIKYLVTVWKEKKTWETKSSGIIYWVGSQVVILGICICSYPVIFKIHSMTPIVTRIYPLVPYLHVCLYRTRVGEKKIVQFISTF